MDFCGFGKKEYILFEKMTTRIGMATAGKGGQVVRTFFRRKMSFCGLGKKEYIFGGRR